MNGSQLSTSDLKTILSVIAVLIAFIWLLDWRIRIDKELDQENKNETIEDAEKK